MTDLLKYVSDEPQAQLPSAKEARDRIIVEQYGQDLPVAEIANGRSLSKWRKERDERRAGLL
jgi:hypothetical protein